MRTNWLKIAIALLTIIIAFPLQAQRRELQTEKDGFQWYLYSDYDGDKWIELKNGKKIPDFASHQIDWYNSGYIESHKVFYLQNTECPPKCLAAPMSGGLYTNQGELLNRGEWYPFYYTFREHGIIIASKYGHSGVYYNNKVVVPFKYYNITYKDNCYIASTSEYKSEYDIYSNNGSLIGSKIIEYKIINDKLYLIIDGDTYDKNKQKILTGKMVETLYDSSGGSFYKTADSKNKYGLSSIDGKAILPNVYETLQIEGDLVVVKDNSYKYGIFDFTGQQIIPTQFKWLKVDNEKNIVKVCTYDNKYGLYNLNGVELLTPEFDDCELIGKNSIKFKVNGYWGVMGKSGNVYIPTSRQYTKIEYNSTLKTFYFEKEGDYKGECNINGVQTSISKVQTPKTQETKKTNDNKKNDTNTSTSTSTSVTKTIKDNKLDNGILYEGDYTQGTLVAQGSGMTMPPAMINHHIKIYEDHIEDMGTWKYIGTSGGNRVYTSQQGWSPTVTVEYHVDNYFNITEYRPVPGMYGPVIYVSHFSKGNVSYDIHNQSQNQTYSKGSSENPRQIEYYEEDCYSCHGTGKCPSCNGTHRINYQFGSGTLECPNCKPNGACSTCNGSGKVKKMRVK